MPGLACRASASNESPSVSQMNALIRHVDQHPSTALLPRGRLLTQDGWSTVVQCAAALGAERLTAIAMAAGADPSTESNFAIKWAARRGHVDTVNLLLTDRRVDPSARVDCAIQWAAELGHTDVVERLLKDSRVTSSARSFYALKRAAEGGHRDVVRLLLADRQPPGAIRSTALQLARRNGHDHIVALIEQR